jgi:C4-dicarboxylate transporter
VHAKTHRQRNVPAAAAAAAAAARFGPQHSHRVLLQEPAGVSMCTYVLVKQVI